MVRYAIGRVVTRPCDRAGHSFSRPRERAEVRPESTGRRGRFRLSRPRGRLPSMFDTLAVAQQPDGAPELGCGRADARPVDVALNLKGGETGTHRPLEISRAIRCRPCLRRGAARFPHSHSDRHLGYDQPGRRGRDFATRIHLIEALELSNSRDAFNALQLRAGERGRRDAAVGLLPAAE